MGMAIEVADACMVGWGPEAHGPSGWRVGHYCRRPAGHSGRHVCVMCRSWWQEDPKRDDVCALCGHVDAWHADDEGPCWVNEDAIGGPCDCEAFVPGGREGDETDE
jgi:hypothetical protein